jgi:hypothetical protein
MPSAIHTLRSSAIVRRVSLGREIPGSAAIVFRDPAELTDPETVAIYIFELQNEVIRQANVIGRLRRVAFHVVKRRHGYDCNNSWMDDLDRIAADFEPGDLHD